MPADPDDAPETNLAPADELFEVRQQLAVLRKREDRLRRQMLEDPDARLGTYTLITIVEVASQHVDLGLLREHYPEIAAEVTVETIAHRVQCASLENSRATYPAKKPRLTRQVPKEYTTAERAFYVGRSLAARPRKR